MPLTHAKLPPDSSSELHIKQAGARRLVLACGALVYELVELIKHNPDLEGLIDLQCLPAHLHNTPQLIAGEVDKYLSEHASRYESVLVAYGDCGTAGALDSVLQKHGAERMPGAHCYEFFAGSKEFDEIVEEELGSFFLTDFLVKFFDRIVVQGLGIDRYPELKDEYFKHYKQLVYLAQTEDAELQTLARQCAKTLGLDYQYKFVGFDALLPATDFPDSSSLSAIRVEHVFGSKLDAPITWLEARVKGALFDCKMCGNCVLSSTGMTCPMNCPKTIRNGPCGGVRANGNCEVKPEMKCVWVEAWSGSQKMKHSQEIELIQFAPNHQHKGSSAWIRLSKEDNLEAKDSKSGAQA